MRKVDQSISAKIRMEQLGTGSVRNPQRKHQKELSRWEDGGKSAFFTLRLSAGIQRVEFRKLVASLKAFLPTSISGWGGKEKGKPM